MSDVRRWLARLGLGQFADKFERAQIDLESLPLLTERDLRELRIPVGPRRKLLAAIAEMRKPASVPEVRNPAERRQLTIVFCDMVGSTEFASRLDPEDFSQLTQVYLSRCSALAKSHGGLVANYVGDAFQVLFGYPEAEENDAERALSLAFDVIAAVSQIESPDGSKLRVRIGIASGLVVVGDIEGAPAGVSTVAFGPIPNLAQRLETLAEPGTILVDQNTYQAAVRTFEFEDLGTNSLKGFNQPVHVRRATKALASNYRYSGDTVPTRLVGRSSELERLAGIWHSVTESRRGRVVAITGEPGIGKSRLVFEIHKNLGNRKPLIAQCAPAFANSALYPFLRLLKEEVNISDGQSSTLGAERLAAFLMSTGAEPTAAYPIFARLLGMEHSGPPSELNSNQQEHMITTVFLGWLRRVADRDPAILVIEDEQWLDPSSRKLLQALAKATTTTPVLLLITSRHPPSNSGYGPVEFDHLRLMRLSREEAGELVANLADSANLDGDIVARLLSRAEGVPLFIEELARSTFEGSPDVAGEKVPKTDSLVNVPVSLQSALMSRLDKLGGAKSVAQTAAVIGREFDLNTLAHVVGVTADAIRPQIDQLIHVGLVAPQPFSDWPRYAFSHSLLQEAACSALLRDRRRQLHALVAEAIELIEPKTVAEHPEVLAQHYDEATLFERAADYWLTAGRKLGATWAKVEAANMYARGIECARRIPQSDVRDRKELTLELERGDVLYAAYGYMTAEGSAAYRNVMRLSEITGDSEAAILALDGLFGTAFNSARFPDAEWASNQLKQIGLRDNSVKGLVLGLQFGGMCAFARGNFAAAREALEEALRHRELAHAIGSDFPSMAMIYLSWTLLLLGEEKGAVDLFSAAEQDARRQTDYRVAACLGNGCFLMALRQDTEALRRLVDELIPLATRNGFQLWLNLATFFSGWVRVVTFQDASGIAQMQHICDNMGEQEIDKTCYLGVLADSYLRMGRLEEATTAIDQGLKLGERTGEHYYMAELLRLRGELSMRAKRREEAERSIRDAINLAIDQGADVWKTRAMQSLASLG